MKTPIRILLFFTTFIGFINYSAAASETVTTIVDESISPLVCDDSVFWQNFDLAKISNVKHLKQGVYQFQSQSQTFICKSQVYREELCCDMIYGALDIKIPHTAVFSMAQLPGDLKKLLSITDENFPFFKVAQFIEGDTITSPTFLEPAQKTSLVSGIMADSFLFNTDIISAQKPRTKTTMHFGNIIYVDNVCYRIESGYTPRTTANHSMRQLDCDDVFIAGDHRLPLPKQIGKMQLAAIYQKLPIVQTVLETFYRTVGLYDINEFIRILNDRFIKLAKICDFAEFSEDVLLKTITERPIDCTHRQLADIILKAKDSDNTATLMEFLARHQEIDTSARLQGLCPFDDFCTLYAFADLHKVHPDSKLGKIIIRRIVRDRMQSKIGTAQTPSSLVIDADTIDSLIAYGHMFANTSKTVKQSAFPQLRSEFVKTDTPFVSKVINIILGLINVTDRSRWQFFTSTPFITAFDHLNCTSFLAMEDFEGRTLYSFGQPLKRYNNYSLLACDLISLCDKLKSYYTDGELLKMIASFKDIKSFDGLRLTTQYQIKPSEINPDFIKALNLLETHAIPTTIANIKTKDQFIKFITTIGIIRKTKTSRYFEYAQFSDLSQKICTQLPSIKLEQLVRQFQVIDTHFPHDLTTMPDSLILAILQSKDAELCKEIATKSKVFQSKIKQDLDIIPQTIYRALYYLHDLIYQNILTQSEIDKIFTEHGKIWIRFKVRIFKKSTKRFMAGTT